MFNDTEFKTLQERECEAFYKWADMPDSDLKKIAQLEWLNAKAAVENYAKTHGLM